VLVTGAFTAPGQLRVVTIGTQTFIEGNTDLGFLQADLRIQVQGTTPNAAGDYFL
jgi:hypothetical protein